METIDIINKMSVFLDAQHYYNTKDIVMQTEITNKVFGNVLED